MVNGPFLYVKNSRVEDSTPPYLEYEVQCHFDDSFFLKEKCIQS